MALSPVTAVVFALSWSFFVSVMTSATYVEEEIPSCRTITAILSGCDSTVGKILSVLVLGTIPGATLEVNLVFALLGVAARGVAIWGIIELLRGT